MTPNPNPSPELLPCPFCGGEATLVTGGRGTLVSCYNDQCISSPEPFNDYGHLQAAVDAWNTRALSPQTLPAPGEVERSIAQIDTWNEFFAEELTDGNDGYRSAEVIERCRTAFDAAWPKGWEAANAAAFAALSPTIATVAAANDEGVARTAIEALEPFTRVHPHKNEAGASAILIPVTVADVRRATAAIRLLSQGEPS